MASGKTRITEMDSAAIRTELAYREARRSYYAYCKLANSGFIPTKLHEYTCNRVQEFMEKAPSASFDIMLISMPPQFGKSTCITETLPSWFAGMHPDKDVIIVSYSDDTASKFGRANRAKLETFSARPFDVVSPLFPNYCRGDVWNNDDICNTNSKYIRSRGIFGAITSNPADLVVIDDPIKTMQEAQSDTTKDSVWGEYYSSVTSRVKPRGKVIVIATRWVEDDLIGRIMATVDSKRLTTLFLPCECTDPEHDPLGRRLGDSLCPEIGRDNAWLREFKAGYVGAEGLYTWSALYQCDPTPIAGALVDPDWWKYYDYSDDLPFSMTYISVDCTFKGTDTSDFVAAEVWSMVGGDYYLRDMIHDHLSFTQTLDAIRDLAGRYSDYVGILIEDKANGSAVIDSLQSEYDSIIPVTPAGGKESRVNASSRVIRQGRVYLPRSALWLESFIHEFTSFPNGKHDDMVDSATQVLNFLLYTKGTDKTVQSDANSAKIRIAEWTSDQYDDYYSGGEDQRQQMIHLWGYPKYGFADE